MLLAAIPTGVTQIAILIQLVLAAFGVSGMVEAGIEAVKHASNWLTLAWTASGDEAKIAAASRELIKMLVSIALAALSYLGVKANVARAVTIASSLPTGMLPAMAVAGGGHIGSGSVFTPVKLGPPGPAGAFGTASMMTKVDEETIGSKEKPGAAKEGTKTDEPQQTAAERDWEKAEAEVKRQQAEADKPRRTEHGALREQERGALTADEQVRLENSSPHTQSDGATVKILRERGGKYTVAVVNQDGTLRTVMKEKTTKELTGLSDRYGWFPPWE
jgi:hypothetical protein